MINDKATKNMKKKKQQAFMSFLQAPTTAENDDGQKNMSDPEDVYEYVDNCCGVCAKQLPQNSKKCGFCCIPTCNEHLRKRRKKKNKWQRICDLCEDKHLYDIYMKLQTKAEESLAVEEEITILKHQNFIQDLEQKREQRRELAFKTKSIEEKKQKVMTRLLDKDNKLVSFENKLQSDKLVIKQLEAFVEKVSIAMKVNLQEDYQIMQAQNQKLGRELANVQKKVHELKYIFDKREKQIQQAYENWQRRQFNQQLQNKQEKTKKQCIIY